MKADAESHADEDKKKTERLGKLNMAESSIYQTTTLLEEMKDKLTDDQKTSLTTALDNLKAVYDVKDEDRNIESIETATKALNEVWYKVSAELNKPAEEATQTQEQPAE